MTRLRPIRSESMPKGIWKRAWVRPYTPIASPASTGE